MAVQITVVNLNDNTELIKTASDAAIAKALEMCGMKAEGYAADLSPVDTGRLRNSITHAPEGKYTEVIGTNVEYAAFVELGTSSPKRRAQPYLKPALLNHIHEYESIIKSVLQSG